jgi:hypothetical protein
MLSAPLTQQTIAHCGQAAPRLPACERGQDPTCAKPASHPSNRQGRLTGAITDEGKPCHAHRPFDSSDRRAVHGASHGRNDNGRIRAITVGDRRRSIDHRVHHGLRSGRSIRSSQPAIALAADGHAGSGNRRALQRALPLTRLGQGNASGHGNANGQNNDQEQSHSDSRVARHLASCGV